MRGISLVPTYVGRVIIVVGFLMIVVAWNGAAELDFIQGQFPYLLSGAMPGLALIIVGAGLEYVQTVRQSTAERAKQMAALNLNVVKLIGYVKDTGGLIQGPEGDPIAALEADETARLAALDRGVDAPQASSGGAGAAAAATAVAERTDEKQADPVEEKKADPADQIVVAGRASFHDPECHLVSGRDDMASITRLEAEGQGLSACRVCKP